MYRPNHLNALKLTTKTPWSHALTHGFNLQLALIALVCSCCLQLRREEVFVQLDAEEDTIIISSYLLRMKKELLVTVKPLSMTSKISIDGQQEFKSKPVKSDSNLLYIF